MSPQAKQRQRVSIVLNMVMAFVVILLLGQLWLFTLTLDAVQSEDSSDKIWIAALTCSTLVCSAVWGLIRFFLRAEKNQ